jgi:hypothetical protein
MINKNYLYEKIYMDVLDFHIQSNSLYIYSRSSETRSYYIANHLENQFIKSYFVELEIVESENDIIIDKNTSNKYNLRDSDNIINLLNSYRSSAIYIDTTGMSNRIVSSLLKNAILLNKDKTFEINVVYVEPCTYKIDHFKKESIFNDLSEKIHGIKPLPGFASIIPNTDEIIFIALLGFEGGRFSHILEQIQPPLDNIIPVVGVPGFRIEYPFATLWGNRQPLTETISWDNIKYVKANSVVDIFMQLKKIRQNVTEHTKIVLAPIGTKPHAVGAILFAISFSNQVEIVYDNPKRKINRTDGIGQIIVCNISSLLRDELL